MLKATGMVRNVDDLGRVVLPMELRRRLRIKAGTPVEIFTEDDTIILKRYNPLPDAVEYVEDALDRVLSEPGADEEVAKKLKEILDILRKRETRVGN